VGLRAGLDEGRESQKRHEKWRRNWTEFKDKQTGEEELIKNKISRYGHILAMNEDRNPKKVLNTELEGKHPTGRPR
jgi:hypothetical protein